MILLAGPPRGFPVSCPPPIKSTLHRTELKLIPANTELILVLIGQGELLLDHGKVNQRTGGPGKPFGPIA